MASPAEAPWAPGGAAASPSAAAAGSLQASVASLSRPPPGAASAAFPQALRGPILCGMRAIWTARNKRNHGETSMSITQACRWARDMASDLIQTSGPCAKGKQGATAVMIRDDMGQVIAIRCKWYNDISIVLSAEALACWDGAELMASLK